MVTVKQLKQLFLKYKEQNLSGRYINNNHVLPIIESLRLNLEIEEIGKSVLNKPIFSFLIWER